MTSGPTSANRLSKVEIPCPFDESLQTVVRYECSCGMSQPLCRVYFCRHCLDIRCGFCVSHEVESHYCPNCFQTMPSAEARLKKHRCANCFDCPTCGNTLSTRATSLQVPSSDDSSKLIAKKVYYLACSFCRWTTRDIGLPDQNVASGGWPEPENSGLARFATLQDHYRNMAHKEKLEKENKRFASRKLSYMQLSDKYGLSAAVARKRAGLPPLTPLRSATSGASSLGPISITDESGKDQMIPSESVTIEEVECNPWDSIFETEPNLCDLIRIEQSLAQIDIESDIYPRHKQLMVKRSQRCRQCEHNLSKPEYNPASIKFKIQLSAYYHIPEIKLFRYPAKESLVPGKSVEFMLKIINPTQHPTFIEILDLESALQCCKLKRESNNANDLPNNESGDGDRSSVAALLRQPILVRASPQHQIIPNADFVKPRIDGSHGSKVFIPGRDDAAEFDDTAVSAELKGLVDDERVVRWRKGNKVLLAFSATLPARFTKPVSEADTEEEIVTGFGVRFVYTNTVPALEHREVQKVDITIPVYVMLGKMST